MMEGRKMKERILEKFILMEFASGNLDNQMQVNSMISLIGERLGMNREKSGEFLRKSIGLL